MLNVYALRKRIGALCLLALWLPTHAQEAFPNKPVTLVIPFAPGDTDRMLRPVTDRMGQYLGQPVVVSYRPGAGGSVGAGSVASSAPDGYTLVGSSPGSIVVVPLTNPNPAYDTASFAPVAGISLGAMMIVAPAQSPYQTLNDVVAAAKAQPDTLTYGTSGMMGISHLLGEAFASAANVRLSHVPFQGSTPAITALLGGHTDLAVSAVGPAQAHIQAGSLKALAVFSNDRLAAWPQVPTLIESGYDVGSPSAYGLLAPKDTPPRIINRLYEAVQKVMREHGEEVRQSLAVLGAEAQLLDPKAYADYLRGQVELFSKAARTVQR